MMPNNAQCRYDVIGVEGYQCICPHGSDTGGNLGRFGPYNVPLKNDGEFDSVPQHSLQLSGFEGRKLAAAGEEASVLNGAGARSAPHVPSLSAVETEYLEQGEEEEPEEPETLGGAAAGRTTGPFAHRGSRRLLFGGLNSGVHRGGTAGTSFGTGKASFEGPAPSPQCTCQKVMNELIP